MSVKQNAVKRNAIDHATEFPQAANVVNTSFYVDDCLTGRLKKQLSSNDNYMVKGEFLLRKWNSNNTTVLQNISSELRDSQQYTKTLGIEWSAKKDHFRLVSDIAKTFDVVLTCHHQFCCRRYGMGGENRLGRSSSNAYQRHLVKMVISQRHRNCIHPAPWFFRCCSSHRYFWSPW